MSDDIEKIMRSMRHMAWERAKGELRAALSTYWPEYASGGKPIEKGYKASSEAVNKFIKHCEDNGLLE